jgi:RecA/RadA recombinase
MLVQPIQENAQSAHVGVLGNEKGGSGKSTTALHIAVALLKAGERVASAGWSTAASPIESWYATACPRSARATNAWSAKA